MLPAQEQHLQHQGKLDFPPTVYLLTHTRLFRPIRIPSVGTLQDGGLKHNNPINLALWESRHIWPSMKQPDVVVSMGTGTTVNESASRSVPNSRHIILDGFVPRLWRSWISSLDGEATWRNLWNSLDETARAYYFRTNVYLPHNALAIDDVGCMDQLRDCVHTQPHNDRFRQVAAFALLVACFYFELTSLPLFQNGKVYCKGAIRCRLRGPVICQALDRVHPSVLVFLAENEIIGYYKGDNDLCPICRRYQKEVEFTIRHINEPMTIFFQSVLQGKRRISGFPQTMQWFQEQQHLNAHFGKPYHNTTRGCERCDPQELHGHGLLPQRQRGKHYSHDTSARKRPRLH